MHLHPKLRKEKYDQIDKVLRATKKHEILVIMRYLNAKVGKRKCVNLIGDY